MGTPLAVSNRRRLAFTKPELPGTIPLGAAARLGTDGQTNY
ncbi:hypothetical protein [Urbifossiella limnaea]|nr:hypothetical protein [Urbifossiella limnaea]